MGILEELHKFWNDEVSNILNLEKKTHSVKLSAYALREIISWIWKYN